MSILIKDMEMPETCCDCNFNIAGWCAADLASERIEFPGRPDWCPLVEVPKHGRLIDADNLIELCEIMTDKCGETGESVWGQYQMVAEDLPTIIEAEVEP